LPFCQLRLKARKPKPAGYPKSLETLGDRIRAKRMDLGLQHKDVANIVGAEVLTVCNWEMNRTSPSTYWIPKLIAFLGYSPYVPPSPFLDWLDNIRRSLGLSWSELAGLIGVDPGTLRRWLKGDGRAPSNLRDRIAAVLSAGGPT